MSFGDNTATGPLSSLMGGLIKNFDSVLGPAFGFNKKKPAEPSSPSLASTPAPSTDTPGRHKSLLGQ